mmetsp:Transcript_11357/g.17104  ORF Transcript_11357/g.17104 Transcript_11357/m.17104 type:complete len:452 (+) Transcript_11357:166-1521(+)|eukprot:CAMPEP_0206455974 /NCGR_PEP_ID=MMETSP0324_2-20121206/22095_1 /ASSEMBLY_ACC=CAM_ASM_000836 /TAXON_ID=2866 /ORGANISM="Crypthecodinium cohnii, Strain Seligo" /LENGTH=451 /DNA_ID=CAMNT_0053926827 /DNA_START=181 /DNA_END=1536 /DNA_ORIENTATION=+
MASTAAANASVAVGELSLFGLLQRLELVEKYKGFARTNDDEQAIIDTEAETKKRVPEALGELAKGGITSAERKSAISFLEKLLKGVEPGTKAGDAKKAKLEELLEGVKAASNAEEPQHVRKARTEQAKAQQDFDTVHKEFEKWEKGKKMLKVDELNKLKRAHDDASKRLEAATSLIEDQLCRRAEAAAALPSVLSGARPSLAAGGPSKAKAPTARVSNPTVRKAPSAAAAATGGYPGPSSAAMRQAQAAAQVRQEVAMAMEAPVQPKAPPMAPARPRPQKVEEEPEVILSYACTCSAVAELLGIKEKQAAELAERAKDFKEHLPPDLWQQVQKRSLEIEKEKKDKAKEAERRKQEKALAKVSGVSSVPMAPTAAAAAASGGGASAKGKLGTAPPPPKAKGKAKPKGAPPPVANLKALATNNRFGGMMAGDDSSDDDAGGGGGGDGWTTVKR